MARAVGEGGRIRVGWLLDKWLMISRVQVIVLGKRFNRRKTFGKGNTLY